MRKLITILGTLLIAVTILISGSAVAPWVTWIYEENTSDTDYINGAPNGYYASLGKNGPPAVLGLVVLDLGAANAMGPNQQFTVFADSSVSENYTVAVSETAEDDGVEVGSGEDTQNHTFYTPSTPRKSWRYIILTGTSGVTAYAGGDYYYGPDIDAVGWY